MPGMGYTRDERVHLAQLIYDVMTDYQRAIASTHGDGPLPLSDLLSYQPALQQDHGVRSNELAIALASARMSVVVATDFGKAFASLLMQDDLAGFALGSVARSAVESAGRAYYLLSHEDATDLLRRWAKVRKLSLTTYVSAIPDADGLSKTEGSEVIAAIESTLTTLGLTGRSRNVTHGYMAVTLCDLLHGEGNGSREYSYLSSIAHGDGSAADAFTTIVEHGTGPHGMNFMFLDAPSNLVIRCWLALAGGIVECCQTLFRLADFDATTWRGLVDRIEVIGELMHD